MTGPGPWRTLMTSGFHDGDDLGPSSFDEFLARVYGSTGGFRSPARRLDISSLMNEEAQDLLGTAVALAAERGRASVDTQHLLWAAAVTEPARPLLARAGGDPSRLAAGIEDSEPQGLPGSGPLALTRAAKRVVMDAHYIAQMAGATSIGPGHLLLAMAANPETAAGRALAAAGITPEGLRAAVAGEEARPGLPGRIGEPGPGAGPGRTATPVLDELGRDLTALAREGRIDPVIGRDDEIEQTVEVLSRRGKNNPVLIGEAGVGKTAIVEGIAQRIAGAAPNPGPGPTGPGSGGVPPALAGRRVIQLELSGVVA